MDLYIHDESKSINRFIDTINSTRYPKIFYPQLVTRLSHFLKTLRYLYSREPGYRVRISRDIPLVIQTVPDDADSKWYRDSCALRAFCSRIAVFQRRPHPIVTDQFVRDIDYELYKYWSKRRL